MPIEERNEQFAEAYGLISFEKDEVLRFFSAFIASCSDYKIKIADIIIDNFTAETYTVSEILEILDKNIKPSLQILFTRNCNLMKEKYWPLKLYIYNEELNFFYISEIILKAFVADCALFVVSKKYKNISNDQLPKDDLRNYFITVRNNASSRKDVILARERLYPTTAEYINNILGVDIDLPFVKQELAEYLNFQICRNANQERIFYPEVYTLYDVLNYKIYSFTYSHRKNLVTRLLNSVAKPILKVTQDTEVVDNSSVITQSIYDEFGAQNALDNYAEFIWSNKTDDEKKYILADTFIDISKTCEVCDEFHRLLQAGVKEGVVQSIYHCQSQQQKSLEKLKELLKLGDYNKPNGFERFLLNHGDKIYSFYIELTDDKEKLNQQKEYERRKRYFNSSFIQLFYRELSGLTKQCIKDKEQLETNNSKDEFLNAKVININEWDSILSGFRFIDNEIDWPVFDRPIIYELERHNQYGVIDTFKLIYAYFLRLYCNDKISKQDLKCLSHKSL